jgi:hypothetical protein
MVKLTCKLGTSDIQIVEVEVTDPLSILKEKLDITDNRTKFIFKGVTYMVNCNLNFKDIGLTSDSLIFFNSPAISG